MGELSGDAAQICTAAPPTNVELFAACARWKSHSDQNARLVELCQPIEVSGVCGSGFIALVAGRARDAAETVHKAAAAPARPVATEPYSIWSGRTETRPPLTRAGGTPEPDLLSQALGAVVFVAIGLLAIWQFSKALRRVAKWPRPSVLQMVAGATAVALLAALLPLPYAFYMALRVVVFGAGLYCGMMLAGAPQFQRGLAAALLIAALTFNPFLPADLTREIWAALNVAGAALFGWAAWKNRPLLAQRPHIEPPA